MAKKQQQKVSTTRQLIRKYRDVVGRIVSVFKEPKANAPKKVGRPQYNYTIETKLYDRDLRAVAFLSYAFKDRQSCFKELKRYPMEHRENLK